MGKSSSKTTSTYQWISSPKLLHCTQTMHLLWTIGDQLCKHGMESKQVIKRNSEWRFYSENKLPRSLYHFDLKSFFINLGNFWRNLVAIHWLLPTTGHCSRTFTVHVKKYLPAAWLFKYTRNMTSSLYIGEWN